MTMRTRRGVVAFSLVIMGAAAMVAAPRAADVVAPRFEVDATWPKALPHRWLMGQASGVAVDGRDHVWVLQRPRTLTEDERGAALTPPRSICCVPAPPVMEFDAAGTLVQAWG